MPTYAIGDVQGCFDCLQTLLAHIQFNDASDTLWFCGDLINRGRQDLDTLRFIKQLGARAICVLGNHDLHALAVYHLAREAKSGDTFIPLFSAPDGPEIMAWLRQKPLIHFDSSLNFAMVHAGISPHWSFQQALQHADSFQQRLQNTDDLKSFFNAIYGNQPAHPNYINSEADQLRFIFNSFTRMRVLDNTGAMDLKFKGPLDQLPKALSPWFLYPRSSPQNIPVVFGHWSALNGYYQPPFYGIDTGCVWGGQLTALRLEDQELFSIAC